MGDVRGAPGTPRLGSSQRGSAKAMEGFRLAIDGGKSGAM